MRGRPSIGFAGRVADPERGKRAEGAESWPGNASTRPSASLSTNLIKAGEKHPERVSEASESKEGCSKIWEKKKWTQDEKGDLLKQRSAAQSGRPERLARG